MAESKTKQEPFRKVLSENVEVLYGWKDGHAVVKARLPIPLRPWYSLQVKAENLITLRQTFSGALEFGEGKSSLILVDPIQIEIRDDCMVRWGFKDRHLEFGLKRLGMWLWFNFTFEEQKTGKVALDDASGWAELPIEVRELQGIA